MNLFIYLLQENHFRASATALSEILIAEPLSTRKNDRIKQTRESMDATQKPTTSTHRNANRKEHAKHSSLKQSLDSQERSKTSAQPTKKSTYMKPMILPMKPLPPLPPFIPPAERNDQSPALFRSLSAR